MSTAEDKCYLCGGKPDALEWSTMSGKLVTNHICMDCVCSAKVRTLLLPPQYFLQDN